MFFWYFVFIKKTLFVFVLYLFVFYFIQKTLFVFSRYFSGIFVETFYCAPLLIKSPKSKMKPEIQATKRDSDESIKTSPTLRAKGKAISRCFISLVKIFRMCTKRKKKQERG